MVVATGPGGAPIVDSFGFASAPGVVVEAMPTRQPNQKGSAVVEVRPGGFSCSWSQPNRIIATLAPATAITALIDVIPK